MMRAPVEGGPAYEIAASNGRGVPQCSSVSRCVLYDARGGTATLYELDPIKGIGAVLGSVPRGESAHISADGSEFSYVVDDRQPQNRIRTGSFVGRPPRDIVVRNARNLENLD